MSNYCIIGYVGKIGSSTKICFTGLALSFSKRLQQNLLPVLSNTEFRFKKKYLSIIQYVRKRNTCYIS